MICNPIGVCVYMHEIKTIQSNGMTNGEWNKIHKYYNKHPIPNMDDYIEVTLLDIIHWAEWVSLGKNENPEQKIGGRQVSKPRWHCILMPNDKCKGVFAKGNF
jgi:hypothetical protein